MLNLRRNVTFSVVELVTNIVLLFVTYRIIVRLGGPALLGLWSTLFAWLSLTRIGDVGIGGAITRYVAGLDAKHERDRVITYLDTAVISNSVLYAVLLVPAGFLGFTFMRGMVGASHVEAGLKVFPWMLCGLLASNISAVVLNLLIALHISYQRSCVTVAGNVIQLALAVVLVPRMGLVGFAIAQLTQFVVSSIVGWVLVCVALGRVALPSRFSWAVLREMLNFSLMLQAASLTAGLFEPLSKLLVSHFGGLATQGLYEAAYKTAFLVRNIAVQASTATIPTLTRLAQVDWDGTLRLYRTTRRNVTLAVGVACLLLLPGAFVISQFWFGHINRDYLLFVTILACGIFASGWAASAYNLGLAIGYVRANVLATSLSLIVLGIFGTLAGALGRIPLIVVAATAAMILASFVTVRRNEQALHERKPGLYGHRVAA